MSGLKSKSFKPNHYDLLEVSMGADEGEIRRAYDRIRDIYSENSPVTYGLYTETELTEIREQIESAFRMLIDPENRREYDKTLISAPIKKQQKQIRVVPKEPVSDLAEMEESEEYALDPDEEPKNTENENDDSPPDSDSADNSIETSERPLPSLDIPEDAEISGPLLKQLRQEAGIALRAVSEKTKISITNLRLLEAEEWEKLPALVYVKGFIVQYSRYMKLDDKVILNALVTRYRNSKDYSRS